MTDTSAVENHCYKYNQHCDVHVVEWEKEHDDECDDEHALQDELCDCNSVAVLHGQLL